jgi:DGQHR domain-containing protein
MLNVSETEASVMARPTPSEQFERPATITTVSGGTLRSGVMYVVGFMPVGVLFPDNFEIPYYNSKTKRGYQRDAQQSRVNTLANDLYKERTDLPTAVLLNIRDRLASQAVSGSGLDLNALTSSLAGNVKFYIVDGQHRILALKKLYEEKGEHWGNYLLPFVCMLGADERAEMEQFYTVNSNAKSVRTDLAYTLLRKMSDGDEAYHDTLIEKGRDWQVRAQSLVERLTSESSVWKGRIRLANAEKEETTITAASMVNSLKSVLDTTTFQSIGDDRQILILEAFWEGVRDILRPAFDKPEDYSVQKGVGVMTLHALFPLAMDIARSKGELLTDATTYTRIFQDALNKVEGENNYGESVRGLDFWKNAKDGGAAGSYSSTAGRRVLTAKIRQYMPTIEVE